MRIRALWLPLLALLLTALVAGACGGGDDDGDGDGDREQAAAQTEQTERADDGTVDDGSADDDEARDDADDEAAARGDAEGAYENSLKRIVDEVELELDEAQMRLQREILLALDGVDLDDEEAVGEAIVETLLGFSEVIRGITADGVERLERLDPPARYEEDHERFLAGVRQLTDLQASLFEQIAESGFDLDAGFETIGAEGEALEAELEAGLSADFLALVANFFAVDDDIDADFGDLLGEDSVTLTEGDRTLTLGGDLVEGFPEGLVPPDSTLQTSVLESTSDGDLYSAIWQSEQSTEDLLAFFEQAFADLGVEGESDTFAGPGLASLEISAGDQTLAGVFITEAGGTTSVVLQYLDRPE